jgi:hypothetical protein
MRNVIAALGVLGMLAGCSGSPGGESFGTSESDLSGNPTSLNIGFNGGADSLGVEQFGYYSAFFTQSAIHPGPRICHTYVLWNLAEEPDGPADADATAGTRTAFKAWLAEAGAFDAAENHVHCDEVLVSFKAQDVDDKGAPAPGAKCLSGKTPPCGAPDTAQYTKAVEDFVSIDWKAETGFGGTFAFTPWNEPNNQFGAGNGLGEVIPPERAAQMYLELDGVCASHGCKVAAGDFASNGDWWDAFEWNCADDNVAKMTHTDSAGHVWCDKPSSENPGNAREASYLDRYKNTIALDASKRPAYFAYHGWHDANDFLDAGNPCDSYDDCATRRILQSLGGSWGSMEIWDTEVGASQGATITDEEQAKTAAFLVQLATLSKRITRLYYTRLYGGGGELLHGSTQSPTLRPALCVLADRDTSVTGVTCAAK